MYWPVWVSNLYTVLPSPFELANTEFLIQSLQQQEQLLQLWQRETYCDAWPLSSRGGLQHWKSWRQTFPSPVEQNLSVLQTFVCKPLDGSDCHHCLNNWIWSHCMSSEDTSPGSYRDNSMVGFITILIVVSTSPGRYPAMVAIRWSA